MATRLADAGVDVWGPTRAATAWAETLGDFRLDEVDGRIVGRRSLEQAESLVSDISSAKLTIDGLRWLAAPERDSKLVRQLYAYLDDARIAFDRRPTVELPRGAKVRPTARINLPKRTVLVQAVGGSEQGLEHALSLVQRIERADYAFDQRLVLLKGSAQAWPADHLDLLADHTRGVLRTHGRSHPLPQRGHPPGTSCHFGAVGRLRPHGVLHSPAKRTGQAWALSLVHKIRRAPARALHPRIARPDPIRRQERRESATSPQPPLPWVAELTRSTGPQI
ncbi:hypothetical protein [Streptomyces sp. NPDC090112]|uniref:hypothetical protein n=1 Tax=Streptomyces sp. NPDC090112 TaxID=3365949 RepID=UPI00382F76A0